MNAEPVAECAGRIADEVLFPAAMAVDGATRVPESHLGLLAREGLYGLAGPAGYGGLDLDPRSAIRIIEILASGCGPGAKPWTPRRPRRCPPPGLPHPNSRCERRRPW